MIDKLLMFWEADPVYKWTRKGDRKTGLLKESLFFLSEYSLLSHRLVFFFLLMLNADKTLSAGSGTHSVAEHTHELSLTLDYSKLPDFYTPLVKYHLSNASINPK